MIAQLLMESQIDYYLYYENVNNMAFLRDDLELLWNIWMIDPSRSSQGDLHTKSHFIDLRLMGGIHPESMTPLVKEKLSEVFRFKDFLLTLALERFEADSIAFEVIAKKMGNRVIWQSLPDLVQNALYERSLRGLRFVIQALSPTSAKYWTLRRNEYIQHYYHPPSAIVMEAIRDFLSPAADKPSLATILRRLVMNTPQPALNEDEMDQRGFDGHEFHLAIWDTPLK